MLDLPQGPKGTIINKIHLSCILIRLCLKCLAIHVSHLVKAPHNCTTTKKESCFKGAEIKKKKAFWLFQLFFVCYWHQNVEHDMKHET